MHEYIVKTIKVGDTIVVALPHELLITEHVREDMVLKITVQKCQSSVVTKRPVTSDVDDPWGALE